MRSTIKDINELPVGMRIEDCARVLGVSRATMFIEAKRPDFPKIKVGQRRWVIPRDKFLQWMERKAEEALV